MKNPAERLEKFLEDNYIKEDGASDIDIAIRDVLTDLLHLGDKHGIVIEERLVDAKEVYEAECTLELQNKTGVSD